MHRFYLFTQRKIMKILHPQAKWFVSFAFTVLIAAGTFTGCASHDNGTSPSDMQSSLNLIAANGVNLGPAIAIQNSHTDELLAIDGVIGTGTGLFTDGTPTIYILTNRDGVAGLPSSLEGIHTTIKNVGVIEAGIPSVDGGLGTRKLTDGIQAVGFTGQYRAPMYSGVSVGNDKECAAGTISCVVTKNGKKYLLSNNHVFARVNAAKIGERIDQQGRYDAIPQCGVSGQVASLSQYVPINFNRRALNTIDCAISEVTAGINWTSQTPPEIAPAWQYTPSATTMLASVGMNVMKTGRTTGFTTGQIAAINVTVNVSYGNGQTAKYVNQVYINSPTFSAAGDSGSLIVEEVAANPNPVALLFAGSATSTIANPIGDVLSALGVTIIPL